MDRPDDRRVVSRRFRSFRRRALLTQAHLAAILELCRQAVNTIESGRVLPHLETWNKFCFLELRHRAGRQVRSPARWR